MWFCRSRESHKGINTCQISLVRSHWDLSCIDSFVTYTCRISIWDLTSEIWHVWIPLSMIRFRSHYETSQVRFDMYWFLCDFYEILQNLNLRSIWDHFISYLFLYRRNASICTIPIVLHQHWYRSSTFLWQSHSI